MIIEFLGIDPYRVAELSRTLQPKLLRLEGVREEQILFVSSETTLYHHGVDQNTWICLVRLRLENYLQHHIENMLELIKSALVEDTIHIQFDVQLIDPQHIHMAFNSDYPMFVTENNEVDVVVPDEPNADIFLGNAFQDHEEKLEKKAEELDPLAAFKDDETKH